MATLGTAYVQIVPSAQGISGKISQVLNPEVTSAGKSAGAAISNSIGGGFTKAAATGVSAIAGITGALTTKALSGGMARAMAIDEATMKFKQLGVQTNQLKGKMDAVSLAVSGTRYATNEAAATATMFYSAGIKGNEQLTSSLQSVASVASISGAEFGQIGSIFTKVAAKGSVTGEVMAQLMDNGINANAALADSLGKTSDEISAMVSNGEIDFKTFADAMRKYYGDAAESANSTFSGALANTESALNRWGAAFTGPIQEALRTIFAGPGGDNGLIKALDNLLEYVQPAVDAFAKFAEMVGNRVAGALATFNRFMEAGASPLAAFKAMLADLIPESIMAKIRELPTGIQDLLGKFGMFGGIVAGVAGAMGVFSGVIGSMVPGLGALIGPLGGAGGAFKLISTAGGGLTKVIGQLIGGQGLGGLGKVLRVVMGPVGLIAAAFVVAYTQSESFRNAINQLLLVVGQAFMQIIQALIPVFQALMPVIQLAAGLFVQLATVAGNILGPVLQALMPIIQALINVFVGVVTVVARFATGVLNAISGISSIPEKVRNIFEKVKTAIHDKIMQAKAKVASVVHTIKSNLSFSGIVGKVQGVFNKIKAKITEPIEKAKGTVKKAIDRIKKYFPFNIGKIINLKTPSISLKTSSKSILGKSITYPSGFSINWHKKAMQNPYMFEGATLFGAGEAGDEMLYGRRALMGDIEEAVGRSQRQVVINNYITVDGSEDPEAWAAKFATRLEAEMRTA